MSEIQSHQEVEIGSPRSFGVVFVVVFSAIAAWPLLSGGAIRLWSAGIAALLLFLALIAPQVLSPLNRLWFRFGELLGRIVTPIIMAVLFFIVFLPIGLLLRVMGKDLLRLKLEPDAKTYWISRDSEESKMGSMRNQF